MATVEREPLLQPGGNFERLFTVADLEYLPTELPSGPIDYELDNGRLIFVVPPGDTHGAIQSNIATELKIQGERKDFGKVRTEVGVVLRRGPGTVLTPDVLFISKKSLPLKRSREGYLETIPDLVVEVRSKNDSFYIERKVQQYLKAGVKIVWVADATTKTVTFNSLAGEPKVYGENDTLQLPGLIPGFSMSVEDVFRE
jgi:Uma2 family endonuclease